MAAIDFSAPKTQTAAAPAADRTPTLLWMNVGRTIRMENDKGEMEEMFISTPVGIALDTMAPMKGNSKLARFKNEFLKQLNEAALTLEPGQHEFVTGLEIQLSRVNPVKAEPTESEAEVLKQLNLTNIFGR